MFLEDRMLLVKNIYINTIEDGIIDNGYIICEQNKIVAIGEYNIDLDTELLSVGDKSTVVIDGTGLKAYPGFIDSHCHIGMWENGMGFEGADGNEDVDPITPQLRAIDGINNRDISFKEAVEAGITSVVTGPGSANVVGGQFAAMKTCGNSVDEMVINPCVAVKFAFGENPKNVYSEKKQSPVTRMATASILREELFKARNYHEDKLKYEENPEEYDKPEFDFKLEVLESVIEGKIPAKIHAHRADDILTAIRICNEFNIKYTIEHCTEGHLIPELLSKEGVRAIVGPIIADRSKIELSNQSVNNAAILEKNGIEFAIMTDHPEVPIQYLLLSANIARKNGLSYDSALKSITINAAKLCNIDKRVGSLKVGKDADITIMDRDVFDFESEVMYTIINGKVVYKR